jgi:hypothetical protein
VCHRTELVTQEKYDQVDSGVPARHHGVPSGPAN